MAIILYNHNKINKLSVGISYNYFYFWYNIILYFNQRSMIMTFR